MWYLRQVLRFDRGSCSFPFCHIYWIEQKNQDHNLTCPSKTATCSFCAFEFARSNLQDHIASCLEVTVPCSHADNGCSWAGPRRELAEVHIPSCPYESIKGFFAIHGARVSSLSADNTALRQRIQALEGTVHLMQREMQSLEAILGPWYRPEVQRTGRADAHDHHVHVPDGGTLQGFAGSSLSRNIPRRGQAPAAMDPFDMIDAEQDAVAPFFPPSDVVYDNQGHMPARMSGGLLDMQSHPGQRSLPLTPVAPLNLSTTLEGSLVGLRDSITAVAASVDSLARRNDIALTNENMRMNEELGSLKYAVHGIRLQVCLSAPPDVFELGRPICHPSMSLWLFGFHLPFRGGSVHARLLLVLS